MFTDILLVLILSITRIQTKEIKNSSTFQQITETTHPSIAKSTKSDQVHLFSNRPPIEVVDNNLHIYKTQSPPDNHTLSKRSQGPSSSAQLDNFTYTINSDRIEIRSSNETTDLPAVIKDASNIPQNDQTTERDGKQSNILRSALRVAARQGLEAMAELYDKKEPTLISKGQCSLANQFSVIFCLV